MRVWITIHISLSYLLVVYTCTSLPNDRASRAVWLHVVYITLDSWFGAVRIQLMEGNNNRYNVIITELKKNIDKANIRINYKIPIISLLCGIIFLFLALK